MTVDEYRQRTVDLVFPSGLVLTIQPPKVRAMMNVATTAADPAEVLGKLLKMIEERFPEGFTLDDLNDPKDWAYLQEWLGRFFQEAVPGSALKSNSSSSNAISLPGNGPMTS